jgi:hypothetical protein
MDIKASHLLNNYQITLWKGTEDLRCQVSAQPPAASGPVKSNEKLMNVEPVNHLFLQLLADFPAVSHYLAHRPVFNAAHIK